jgi:hypothetical protein
MSFGIECREIRSFSFAQSIYVLSVYYLEILRAKQLRATGIFSYLTDAALQHSIMYKFLETMADEV